MYAQDSLKTTKSKVEAILDAEKEANKVWRRETEVQFIHFLSEPGIPGVRSMGPSVSVSNLGKG